MWQALIPSISNLIGGVLDKIVPDAAERDRLKFEIQSKLLEADNKQVQNEFELLLQQIEVNKIEAKSESGFKSCWRPAIGWVCVVSFAYVSVIEPFARFLSIVAFSYDGIFPDIDTEITMQILLGLLGLAGMRTYEKKNRVNK